MSATGQSEQGCVLPMDVNRVYIVAGMSVLPSWEFAAWCNEARKSRGVGEPDARVESSPL